MTSKKKFGKFSIIRRQLVIDLNELTIKINTIVKSEAELLSIYQSRFSYYPTGSDEKLEEWKMSSIVTLTELGIGFCILSNKMCVKLSGMYRNKY